MEIVAVDLLGAHFERADDDAVAGPPASDSPPDVAIRCGVEDRRHPAPLGLCVDFRQLLRGAEGAIFHRGSISDSILRQSGDEADKA